MLASSCLKLLYTVIEGDHRKIQKKTHEKRNYRRAPLHVRMLFHTDTGSVKKNQTKLQNRMEQRDVKLFVLLS